MFEPSLRLVSFFLKSPLRHALLFFYKYFMSHYGRIMNTGGLWLWRAVLRYAEKERRRNEKGDILAHNTLQTMRMCVT
jgi:hypothetical protein